MTAKRRERQCDTGATEHMNSASCDVKQRDVKTASFDWDPTHTFHWVQF